MPRNSTKPKKKLKTHRGAAKRFKITATGKIMRAHSGKRHFTGTKRSGRMRTGERCRMPATATQQLVDRRSHNRSSATIAAASSWSLGATWL